MSAAAGQLPSAAARRMPRRLRRVLVFSSLAFALATILFLVGLRAFHQDLGPLDWTRFLGAGERTALEQARGEISAASDAPRALAAPGLCVTPMRSEIRGGRQVTSWLATLPADRLLANPGRQLLDHWARLGLKTSNVNGIFQARDTDGTIYAARTAEPDPAARRAIPRLIIWRIRDLPAGPVGRPLPEPEALLPPVSPDMDFTQLGRPGEPGYSICIRVQAAAGPAFEALRGDLLRRGWEPFLEGDVSPALLQAIQRAAGGLSMVFRHTAAPLGCHLLIQPNELGEPPGSRVLLSLF